MPRLSLPSKFIAPLNQRATEYWVLCGFLSLLFIVGGSSRSDTISRLVIDPIILVFFGYGLWNLRIDAIRRFKPHFLGMLAILLLSVGHVLSLPETTWHNLNGRELQVQIFSAAGILEPWYPIAIDPRAASNAFSTVLVAATVLMLASMLDRQTCFRILGVFLVMGLINAILGLLQAIGSSESSLYFYKIRAGNYPSGFFSNRNHFALFLSCLIPMLAVYLSTIHTISRNSQWRIWILCTSIGIIFPLILVSGSRAGLLTVCIGIAATPFLYSAQGRSVTAKNKALRFSFSYAAGILGIAAIGLVTMLASRAATIDRFFDDGGSADARLAIWKPILEMVDVYGVFGAGIGSFTALYEVSEPNELLTFQYVPHAHNDWLETAITLGWPGIILMACLLAYFVRLAFRHFRANPADSREILFGRLGVVILGLIFIASIADYPTRVPSMSGLFVVASLWAAGKNEKKPKIG